MVHCLRGLGLAFVLLFAANSGYAQDNTGSVLAASCFTCHGAGGVSTGEIPSISEYDGGAILDLLTGFRDGTIEATIMTRIAKGYSEAEIAVLAAFLGAGN